MKYVLRVCVADSVAIAVVDWKRDVEDLWGLSRIRCRALSVDGFGRLSEGAAWRSVPVVNQSMKSSSWSKLKLQA